MRIVFMGTPDFSVPVLDALVEAGHDIAAAYCQPPRPAGRGKKERPTPVHGRALELGLDVRHPASLKTDNALADFSALQADIAVVVAYGLILPQTILDAPAKGCLNIHASLLPRWRGAAPIHRAIMAGDNQTGVCIMQMEAGLDTGPVLLRVATDIETDETTGQLHNRLSQLGATAIISALAQLETLVPEAQSDQGITYAAKILKDEAKIDWTKPAHIIDAQIRGLSPFPGAWTKINGVRVKMLGSTVSSMTGPAGTILSDLTIACGDGAVQITRAQREGKSAQDTLTFLNGMDVPPGTVAGV
ncbi:methionyl-tRNA formyltransferase [Algirhabdus cladophorae]|uniref:methionyl-tRNA formyltransferase n=1 Tax=Algirhabdus cladophorae TaxID=3377108 RepID=UPI003B84709B